MLLTEVILRLRAAAPMFEKRVAGTQSFVAATSEDADIELPCAFVVPIGDTPLDKVGNSTAQRIVERFSVVVCADNSVNKKGGRGMSAEVVIKQARAQLLTAFAGWNPLIYPYMDTIQYNRSMHLHMNEARIWHQYDWHAYYYVDGDNSHDNETYNHIETIINGNWPEVDPRLIYQIMMGQSPDIGSGNLADYEAVLNLMQDNLPTWVTTTNAPSPSPLNDPQGDLFGQHFKLEITE